MREDRQKVDFRLSAELVKRTTLKNLISYFGQVTILFFILFMLCVSNAKAVGDTKNSDNKADQNLKSAARVNPSTLAMELSLPLMSYPGRNGNGLSVGISYSSKMWRMNPGLSWWDSPTGTIIYYTQVNPEFAERSTAGWTSSLLSPHIIEKLELYDELGEPISSLLSLAQLTDLYNNSQSNLQEQCSRTCRYHGYGGACISWTDWVCFSLPDFPSGGGGPTGGGQPQPPLPYYIKRVRIQLPDGSTHEFRKDDDVHPYCSDPNNATRCNGQIGEDKTGTFLSVDGSRMRLDRGVTYEGQTKDILYLPDGGRYVFSNTGTATPDGFFRPAEKFIDNEGNQSLYNKTTHQWTDTMGRSITDILPQNWVEQTQQVGTQEISLPGLGTQTQDYKMSWDNLENVFDADLPQIERTLSFWTRQTCGSNVAPSTTSGNDKLFSEAETNTRLCNPRDGNGNAARFNPVVLSEVQLSNGKKYKFKYNRFGEITRIDYPTGSYERFQYKQILPLGTESSITYDQTNRGVKDRWIYNSSGAMEQHWHYAVGVEGVSVSNYVVTTTAPDGMVSKRYLYRSADSSFGFENILSGMPAEERTYDTNGVLRSRKLTEWIGTGSFATPTNTAARDPRPKQEISIIIEGSQSLAQKSEIIYEEPTVNQNTFSDLSFFARSNAIRSKGYHYAVIDLNTAQNGTLAQIASYFNNSLLASVSETDYIYDANYKARGIASLPTETRVLNPSNNQVVAKTQTIYDNAVPAPSANYPSYSIENYGIGASFNCPTSSQSVTCWQSPGSSALGHPTTSRLWDRDNNIWIETHTRYDIFGNAVKVKDAAGNEAETIFENTVEKPYLYAYPTKVITPAPDPTNTHGTNQGSFATTTYDFMTGLSLTSTNEFGQTTATEYNDVLLRPTRSYAVNFAAPESQTIYDDTNLTVKVRKQIDETNWDEAISYSDSLGRTIKTQAKDSQGDVFTETEYDFLGRVKRATNPYRQGDTKLWSKPRYDEMGRAVESFAPAVDGQTGASLGITQYGISTQAGFIGTFVLTTDAAGKQSRALSNALGQLVRVDEPDHTGSVTALPQSTPSPTPTPGGGSGGGSGGGGPTGCAVGSPNCLTNTQYPSNATVYRYNEQGKMVEVIQGDQQRFFKYDSLGRLIRVKQPEQETNANLDLADNYNTAGHWTARFVYDQLGNVRRATDANGTNIINEYDKANRVIKKCYTKQNVVTTATECSQVASNDLDANTPAVEYFYDGKGLANQQSPNFAKGKLTKVTSSVSETLYTQFDYLGRLLQMEQRTPVSGETLATATPRISSYQYDFGGRLIQETYPSGRVVKNEFKADGELLRVYGKANANAVERTYLDSLSYTASGGIERMKLGNGKWETAKFNERLQVTELGLGNGSNDASIWKVNYEYGELENGTVNTAKNTGNIAKQTLNFTGLTNPIIQSYKYDSLYRLTEAKETSNNNQNWIQSFDYDRYGNRTGISQNVGGLINNQTPTVDSNTNRFVANQGFVYDKSGNITSDIDSKTSQARSFIFNGENKQTEVKNVSGVIIGKYYYDGEGKRVKKETDTEITVFVYSRSKLIEEYSTQTPPQNPTTKYLSEDHLGTPRIITDAIGNVISRRDFMPFGEELTINVGARSETLKYGTTADNVRQKFTGYQKDDETSLNFAEARMYNNTYGRFTAVDPLMASGKSSNPQTFNRYIHTLNNPVIMIDGNGLYPVYFNGKTFRTKQVDKTYKPYTGGPFKFPGKDGYYWIVTKDSLDRTNEKVKQYIPSTPGNGNDTVRNLVGATNQELDRKIPVVAGAAAVGIPLGVACVMGGCPALLAAAPVLGGQLLRTGASASTSVIGRSLITGGAAVGTGILLTPTNICATAPDNPCKGGGGSDLRSQIIAEASKFGSGQCDKCANAIEKLITANGGSGEVLTVSTPFAQTTRTMELFSDDAGVSVGNSGWHQGVLYEGTVYDNIHPQGLPYEQWINNFQYRDPITGLPVTAPVTGRRGF